MAQSELLQDPIWKELLSHSALSTRVYATTFLQETFPRVFAPGAKEIFEAIDGPYQKVLIIAHRGLGKTSIASFATPIKRICFRESKFTVLVSATATSAQMNAHSIQRELESNEALVSIFGDLRDKDNWSKEQFKAGNTFILPRGAGQQVRGLKHLSYRPDTIIVDDLEDAEGVESTDRRAKLKQWFFSDLMNSVDRGRDDWKIIVIGTLLHEDSLLANLKKDSTWKVIEVSICDENFKSCHPEFMSDAKVLELYETFRSQGQADVFAREYQNIPISREDAVFKQEYFKYYEPSEILENQDIHFVTIGDPAKTVKLHSADSAVITVGIDLVQHRIYFHDCVAGKFHPDEYYDAIFDQVLQHGSGVLAIEVTGLNEFISQPIKNEMRRRNIHTNFVELHARDKKEMRIAQLAPFYRQGYVYHNPAISAKLETQLMAFPKSALVDVSDALAYVIEVMELDERYFYAEEVPDRDEYHQLKNDRPLDGWRSV